MNVNPAIAAQGENIATELKSFRSAAVTSENRATPLARSVLGGLLAGTTTVALVTAMTIAAFGNPNSPAGKPIAKLSGSGDYLPGWGATRKAMASIFDIFANVDADKPVTTGEGDDAVTVGKGDCRATITAFILNTEGAPKSLRALREAIAAHVKAHAAALTPDNADAVEDAKAAEADANPSPKADAVPLADMVNALIVAYGAASAEEKAEAQAGLTALFLAVDADIQSAASEPAEQEQEAVAA